MVNWWFGLVVWILGIPLWKELLIGVPVESQTTGPQNHQLTISWWFPLQKYSSNENLPKIGVEINKYFKPSPGPPYGFLGQGGFLCFLVVPWFCLKHILKTNMQATSFVKKNIAENKERIATCRFLLSDCNFESREVLAWKGHKLQIWNP